MDSYTDKKGEKQEYDESENPSIRIILKSQETKNLEFVTSTIATKAKESGFTVKGPRFMPNKLLRITTRKSPCGEGK
jgi:small subunit ribosomal protein S20e